MEYGLTLGVASGAAGRHGGGFGGFANYMLTEPIGLFAIGAAVAIVILIVWLR